MSHHHHHSDRPDEWPDPNMATPRSTGTSLSRRSRTVLMQRILALSILGAVFIIPLLLVVVLFSRGNRSAPPAPPPVVYVTATSDPSLGIIPTPVLPAEFFAGLTATAPPEVQPAEATNPFVTATPGVPLVESFSLANSTIAYVCFVDNYDELCLMNGDGSNQRQLTETSVTDFYPSISVDGRLLAFSSIRDVRRFDIYLMAIQSGNILRVTRNMGDNYAPEISPDGTRIVFVSTFGGGQDIWVMDADGSNLAQLTFTEADDIDPTWSPDGQQIAFASNRNGLTDLYVMNADGSNVRQMTFDVNLGGRSDWSNDGRHFTFYAGPAGDKNIYIMSAECVLPSAPPGCSAAPQQLTDGGNNKGPSFSPDGQWITFAANNGGDNDVYIMRIDGSELQRLTTSPWADWQPRWGP
jgi:Tol biopolymer transport system component